MPLQTCSVGVKKHAIRRKKPISVNGLFFHSLWISPPKVTRISGRLTLLLYLFWYPVADRRLRPHKGIRIGMPFA